MKPSRKVSSGIEDLFRSRFENIINLRHELVVLGGRIAWTFFDETYEALYSEEGRPGVPTRLMVGLHILKHMFDLSDEEVCERWVTPTNTASLDQARNAASRRRSRRSSGGAPPSRP